MVSNFLQSMRVKPVSLALLATLTLALSACGGGGGSPGNDNAPPTVHVAIVDSTGAAATSISTTTGAIVRATVRDSGGKGVANAVVEFSSNSDGIRFSPGTSALFGTALTDGSGVAAINIIANGTFIGATNIKINTTVGTVKTAETVIGIAVVTPPAP